MSLKIHPVKRRILAGPDKDMIQTFGQVRHCGVVDYDTLCDKVAILSTATKGDVEVVLKNVTFVVCQQLSNSNIVDMGDFGNLRITAGSKGALSPGEFHAGMMRRPRIIFYPGKRFQRLRNEVKFQQMPVKVVHKEANCDQQHVP